MPLISSIYNNPVSISGNGLSKAKAKRNKQGKKLMVQSNPLWDRALSKGLKPKGNVIKGCTVITASGYVTPVSVHITEGEMWVRLAGNKLMVHPVGFENHRLYHQQGVNPYTAPKVYIS